MGGSDLISGGSYLNLGARELPDKSIVDGLVGDDIGTGITAWVNCDAQKLALEWADGMPVHGRGSDLDLEGASGVGLTRLKDG
jgi:hypothetical protein